MSPPNRRIAVVGAGAWGTALADHLASTGHRVGIWSFEERVARQIAESRTSEYLPDVELHPLAASGRLHVALEGAELIVSAVPCQFVRGVLERARAHVGARTPVVSASKGLELATGKRMSEVIREALGGGWLGELGVISGPSFAAEVAQGTPTAVVVASRSVALAERIQSSMQTRRFRVYTSTDVAGVELAGALKNVIAIASGVSIGLGHGHNTTAALISRGLAEITRLGLSMGADAGTFAGLAGMGDLLLTCTGPLSRNRCVGIRIGRGESLEGIVSEMRSVAEGVRTVEAARALATRQGVEMPITEQLYRIMHRGGDPASALDELMERSPRPEDW